MPGSACDVAAGAAIERLAGTADRAPCPLPTISLAQPLVERVEKCHDQMPSSLAAIAASVAITSLGRADFESSNATLPQRCSLWFPRSMNDTPEKFGNKGGDARYRAKPRRVETEL